jgi:mRNA-degrading endonuclease YafQ of YafQ-DinJ toxin-antitoxin module
VKQPRKTSFQTTPLFDKGFEKLLVQKPKLQEKLKTVVEFKCTIPPQKLPSGFKEHALSGKLSNFMECHLDTNVLLIYTLSYGVFSLHAVCTHDELKTVYKKLN